MHEGLVLAQICLQFTTGKHSCFSKNPLDSCKLVLADSICNTSSCPDLSSAKSPTRAKEGPAIRDVCYTIGLLFPVCDVVLFFQCYK